MTDDRTTAPLLQRSNKIVTIGDVASEIEAAHPSTCCQPNPNYTLLCLYPRGHSGLHAWDLHGNDES